MCTAYNILDACANTHENWFLILISIENCFKKKMALQNLMYHGNSSWTFRPWLKKKRTFFRERTLNCQICIPQCLLTHSFPMHPFSTPLKHQKTLMYPFSSPWKYQKPYRFVEKGCTGNKWVNLNRFFSDITLLDFIWIPQLTNF